jgi:hypothetical protein
LPQTALGVSPDDPISTDHTALIEVAGRATQKRLQLDHPLLDSKRVPPWRYLVVDSLDDPLERLAGRLSTAKRLTILPVELTHGITEQVERLLRHTRDPGLLLVESQTQPFYQPP